MKRFYILIWLITIVSNNIFSQNFPKGRFYEINTIDCFYLIDFNSDSTFSEYQVCDLEPLLGVGSYKYVIGDSLLILYYKNHPDNINTSKSNIIEAEKTDSDSITIYYRILDQKDSTILPGGRLAILKKKATHYFPIDNEYCKIIVSSPDSISNLVINYPSGYYDIKMNINTNQINWIMIDFYLSKQNYHYRENVIDTLYLGRLDNHQIDFKYTKTSKDYNNFVRENKFIKFRKKVRKRERKAKIE